jgi:CspA family cold shock protein
MKVMATGTLKKWLYDRGFGFIKQDRGGPDIFLHRSQVLGSGINPYDLNEGDPLSFEIGIDRKNRPAAINVQLAE